MQDGRSAGNWSEIAAEFAAAFEPRGTMTDAAIQRPSRFRRCRARVPRSTDGSTHSRASCRRRSRRLQGARSHSQAAHDRNCLCARPQCLTGMNELSRSCSWEVPVRVCDGGVGCVACSVSFSWDGVRRCRRCCAVGRRLRKPDSTAAVDARRAVSYGTQGGAPTVLPHRAPHHARW